MKLKKKHHQLHHKGKWKEDDTTLQIWTLEDKRIAPKQMPAHCLRLQRIIKTSEATQEMSAMDPHDQPTSPENPPAQRLLRT
jgi:hypothetical protein